MTADNILIATWTTPFGIVPFDKITDADFLPAFEIAMARHRSEIEAIAGSGAPATFANTVEALELAGADLTQVSAVFWNLAGADSNKARQAIEREMAPRMAQHGNAITSNAALFKRIADLYVSRASLGLTAEQLRVLERAHLGFVRAGAKLVPAQKERMGAIKQRLAALGTQFSQNVLADEKAFELPLATEADRAGLPASLVAAAAEAARTRGSAASHVITLSRSLIEPFLTSSTRRDLRETAFKAWVKRGETGGATDNRKIVAETLALRHERAQLLGYATFADFKLEDTMAKTAPRVRELLETVWGPAKVQAERERARLAALAQSEGANIVIEPWDWRHYAERVRAVDYGIDEAEVKAYLSLDQMIAAAFATATRLFGLQFREVKDLSLYHADVRAFEVTDKEGKPVGLFLGDYFNRPSKRSGAWMSAFRSQQKLKGEIRPIIVNVCNFAKPAAGGAALLSMDDARTLFHEFGHGLHGLMSNVTYPSLSGTAVARDFVELPSQLFEHWLGTRAVLAEFTRHYETGAPMPAVLIDKLNAARTFNQGFATTEFLASAIVDIDFHAVTGAEAARDPMERQAATLARIGMPREIVMRHATPHFSHVFSGDGYSSGYYSYLWSEVLDADAFAAFEETGDVFDGATAEKLATFVYSAGGLREEEAAYQAFRGRAPKVEGLLKKRGLMEKAGGVSIPS